MRKTKDLRIKKSVTVVGHSPDVVELRTGVWNAESYTLTDSAGSKTLYDMVTGLDGQSSRGEIAKRAGVTRAEVEALVDHLDQLNLIEDGPSSALDDYLDRVDTLAQADEPVQTGAPVHLLGDPGLCELVAAQLDGTGGPPVEITPADDPAWRAVLELERHGARDGLALAGLTAAAEAWSGHLVVLAETTINPLRFRALNRMALQARFPWLHAVMDGPFLLVGPTFLPGSSACYECFETRVTMNLRESAAYQRYKDALARGAVRLGATPAFRPLAGLVAAHAALEIVNYVHAGTTFTVEKVLSTYLPTMEIGYHEVLRLPGCAACGPVGERDDPTLYFDPRVWMES